VAVTIDGGVEGAVAGGGEGGVVGKDAASTTEVLGMAMATVFAAAEAGADVGKEEDGE
jgi:hypothetical protein